MKTSYVSFSRSTLRWELLKNALTKTVKRESETRWSARIQAVSVIVDGLESIVELLEKLAEHTTTTSEAIILLKHILTYSFITLVHFWYEILRRFERVQLRLRDPRMNFREASRDLESLATELAEIRDKLCEEAIEKAKSLCQKWDMDTTIRVRRRRKMPGELATDVGLSTESEISPVMKSILDRLQQEICTRFTRLSDLNFKFGFVLDVENVLNKDRVDNDLEKNCKNLGEFYNTDFNGIELFTEICHCKILLRSRKEIEPKTPLEFLIFIISSYGEDVFPNLRVALQILLTISVSIIASCERSFIKLKLIFTYLRSTMGQDRLSDLTFLSVERDKFEMINFDDIIDKFASSKKFGFY